MYHVKLQTTKTNYWPSLWVYVAAITVLAALAFVLFYLYPLAFGWGIGWSFGFGPLPLFWAEHPVLYGVLTDLVRGFYVLTVMTVFTLAFCYLTSIVLDAVLTRQYQYIALFKLAWKETKALVFLQVALGSVLSLLLWKVDSFNALWWLPSFWSSSWCQALYSVAWELFIVLFCCAFALKSNWKEIISLMGTLLKDHIVFWMIFLLVLTVVTWWPAWLLVRWGLVSSVGYILGGAVLQTSALILGLTVFLQRAMECRPQ